MHYYQFNIADYRKDTVHLTPIEHYIYRSLIDWYYLDETPIPKETQVVIRRLSLDLDMVSQLTNVLNDFFYIDGDCYRHNRIDIEILAYHEMVLKNKLNGKLGGRPRKTQSVILDNPNESQKKPNQEPITNNHVDKGIVNNDVADCPHQEIISLYKSILPMGTRPLTWDGSRASQLKARWREQSKRQSLEWWKGFFEHIANSEFLTGRINSDGRKPFTISLDWIIKSENFKKITEGKYHG